MNEITQKKPSKKKAPKLASIMGEENSFHNDSSNEADVKVQNKRSLVSDTAFKGVSEEKPKPVKKVTTTLYMYPIVKNTLEEIQFSERKTGKNQNDLILEGIDLLFKKRGFPSIKKLVEQE